MSYKCIIFDCDGVLVDSEEISLSVLVEMAAAIGVQIELEYALENFAGNSLASCFNYIENKLSQKLPEDFERAYRKASFEAFKTKLKPVNGVHNLLERIKIPFCVASNGPLDKIKLNLTTTGLIEKFEPNIFSAYQIKKWKPAPDLFLHAAKKMGFSNKDCVVIEDSNAGIEAAKAGGFDAYKFIGHASGKTLKEDNNVFFDMDKLDTILGLK